MSFITVYKKYISKDIIKLICAILSKSVNNQKNYSLLKSLYKMLHYKSKLMGWMLFTINLQR